MCHGLSLPPTLPRASPFCTCSTSCPFSLLKENQIQNQTIKKRMHTNTPQKFGICFVLANYSWVWGLSWSVVAIPNVTPLKKTDFPSLSSYHLQIASWSGLCLFVHIPFVLGFCLAWTCAGLVSAVIVSVSTVYANRVVSGKWYLLGVTYHLWLLQSLLPLLYRSLTLEGGMW